MPGLALMAAGDTYRAVDAFMEAVAVNPAYADAWAALARCQYDLGEYERAVIVHQGSLPLRPPIAGAS